MVSSVYIAKSVYGGDGLGRLGDGRVVFVPGAWAGEQVKAEIVEEKRHFVRARLVEVVEPSPERVAAPGPSVPGMVYAGLSCAGERAAKDAQLREFLERARIGVGDFRGADAPASPLNYRNKVVYHFEKRRGAWAIGYREEPGHEVVDVACDPLARPEINAKLPEIRRAVLALLTTGPEAVRRDTERKGRVTVRWTAKSGVRWWIGDAPEGQPMKETACGLDFEVPADGFFQVNPEVGDELAKAVAAAYRAGAAEAPEVVDLYCGVGVLGLCCRPPRLFGMESGRQAVAAAKKNAAAHGAGDATFAEGRVGRSLRRIPVGARTTVVVDPPRGGLEPGVAAWLARGQAPRVIYVSCDPATLTRDLRELAGAFEVESVRRFEMFPRTARFETLVVLRRRKAEGAAKSAKPSVSAAKSLALAALAAVGVAFGAFAAERQEYSRYESIVSRQMFGPLPDGFDPSKLPSEATKTSKKATAELSKEQEKVKSAIRFSVINITPDGQVAVGFTDSSNSKSPKHYYMRVGESRGGWQVKDADPDAATMTIVRLEDSVEVSLSIGGDSAKDAAATAKAGAANQADSARPRQSNLLRRRELRENLAKTQEEVEQMRRDRQAEREERDRERAEREAANAQERQEMRDQLNILKAELKANREAAAAAEAAKNAEKEGDGDANDDAE